MGWFANVSGLEKGLVAGANKEMILVSPDAFSLHNGSFYSNSRTTSDWETFVAVELVNMGGYGTLRIGMKHPEEFSSLCAMSACCMLDTGKVTSAMTQLEAIQTKEEAQKLSSTRNRRWRAGRPGLRTPISRRFFLFCR